MPGAGLPSVTSSSTPTSARPGFTPPELARLYDFPSELNGSGETIALIELGGGYRDADLNTYFAELGAGRPNVTWVSVDGARNVSSGSLSGADAQVLLDIEVAGGVAPRANIVVYFAPNTDRGFVDAVNRAVNNRVHSPTVVSISWGGPEKAWTLQARTALNKVLQGATNRGITVVAASGDAGATDGMGGSLNVDFPGSSPWVLAVGGTRVTAAAGAWTETVWNDAATGGGASGGGFSAFFARPPWQGNANFPPQAGAHPGRGIPDVAANAAPTNGYRVRINGTDAVVGGTAGATPFWAGVIALLSQGVGHPLGFINPILYSKLGPSGALRAVTTGNNSVAGVEGFNAGPGWNPVTGWGSPDGRKLLAALRS
jgi:kumamolisin